MKFFMFCIFPSLVFMSVIFAITTIYEPIEFKSDKNLERVAQGKMSKVFYQGHSYVVWGINWGGGCVHDPDCVCMEKIKNGEQ